MISIRKQYCQCYYKSVTLGNYLSPPPPPTLFEGDYKNGIVRPSVDIMRWVACGRNSSYSFIPIFFLNFEGVFCHGLKMCTWFWGYPPIVFINFSHFFNVVFLLFFFFFFSGPVTNRIVTLWAQLLEFFTDHFETAHTCST